MPQYTPRKFNPNPAIENIPNTGAGVPFGYINPYWKMPADPKGYDEHSLYNVHNQQLPRSSMFTNVPILCALTFKSVDYGNNPYFSINLPPYVPPPHTNNLVDITFDNAIITVNQKKNIVKTKIMGKDGEIKEFIGLDDYDINIKGTILGINGQYPYQAVHNFYQYCILPCAIYVECDYLTDIFGIDHLVINKYDISMKAGGISQQEYELECNDDRQVDTGILYSPYLNT